MRIDRVIRAVELAPDRPLVVELAEFTAHRRLEVHRVALL